MDGFDFERDGFFYFCSQNGENTPFQVVGELHVVLDILETGIMKSLLLPATSNFVKNLLHLAAC